MSMKEHIESLLEQYSESEGLQPSIMTGINIQLKVRGMVEKHELHSFDCEYLGSNKHLHTRIMDLLKSDDDRVKLELLQYMVAELLHEDYTVKQLATALVKAYTRKKRVIKVSTAINTVGRGVRGGLI